MRKRRSIFVPIAILEYLIFQNILTSGIIWTGLIYFGIAYSAIINVIITASVLGTAICVAYDSKGVSNTIGIVLISSFVSLAVLFTLVSSQYILLLLFHYGAMVFIYKSLPRNKYKLNTVILNNLVPDLKNKKLVYLSMNQDSSLEKAINLYVFSMIRREIGNNDYSRKDTEFIVSTSSSGSPFFLHSFRSRDDLVDWLSNVNVNEDKLSCIYCTKLEDGNIKFQGVCRSCFSEITQEIKATNELAARSL